MFPYKLKSFKVANNTENLKEQYYSDGNYFVIFCFALLLPQILVNFQNTPYMSNLIKF